MIKVVVSILIIQIFYTQKGLVLELHQSFFEDQKETLKVVVEKSLKRFEIDSMKILLSKEKTEEILVQKE